MTTTGDRAQTFYCLYVSCITELQLRGTRRTLSGNNELLDGSVSYKVYSRKGVVVTARNQGRKKRRKCQRVFILTCTL